LITYQISAQQDMCLLASINRDQYKLLVHIVRVLANSAIVTLLMRIAWWKI